MTEISFLCVFVTSERHDWNLFAKEESDTCQDYRAGSLLSIRFCSKGNMQVLKMVGPKRQTMLMYGKEASNRKQEIDRQHYTIPNQRPKDKHCGKI